MKVKCDFDTLNIVMDSLIEENSERFMYFENSSDEEIKNNIGFYKESCNIEKKRLESLDRTELVCEYNTTRNLYIVTHKNAITCLEATDGLDLKINRYKKLKSILEW